MQPSNRRVARPKIPREVLESGGFDLPPEQPLDLEEDPIAHEFAPRAPQKPPGKLASIARTTLGVALVLGVSIGAALGARRYVTTTPRFAVSEIHVTGNARRTADDVSVTAGIAKGANVFSLDLDRARARLLADPWIRDATIARRLPGTLSITVVERDAAAIVALGDSYVASRDGEIFKRLEPGDPTDLPVITGLTPDAVADDREAAVRIIKRALDLAAQYERSSLAQRSPLQEVHLAQAGEGGGLTLVIGKSALALELGNPPFHRKLDEAARVIAELDRRGAKPDAIMLDNEAHPERVVVRVR